MSVSCENGQASPTRDGGAGHQKKILSAGKAQVVFVLDPS